MTRDMPGQMPLWDDVAPEPIKPYTGAELICPACGGSSGTNPVHYSINHTLYKDGLCTSQQLKAQHARYDAAKGSM